MSTIMDKGQEKAIKHINGPLLVLAGPGSGKTTVITHRLKYMINEKSIDPSKILVVTFTRNSANEMATRSHKLIGEKADNVVFGTFHSIALGILEEETHIDVSMIISEEENNKIITNLLTKFFPDRDDKKNLFKNAKNDLSLAQSRKEDVSTYNPQMCTNADFIPFYNAYRNYIKDNGKITYDDMLCDVVDLFDKNPNILSKYQKKWEYIMVDEYQDSNPIQESMLQFLAQPQNNIMVVGDDDQSIYGFRGADPKVMLSFGDTFANPTIAYLSTNYRSTNEVIEASQYLIKNNTNRYEKDFTSKKGSGEKVSFRTMSNVSFQNDSIAKSIRYLYSKGIPFSEMAIICRTNRELGMFVENLTSKNIPYEIKEMVDNIYEHWIAKDIFAYLQLALGVDPNRFLGRIVNKPTRYVEKNVLLSFDQLNIDVLKKHYDKVCKPYICESLEKLELNLLKIKEFLINNDTFSAVNFILDDIGYKEYLEERAKEINTPIEELNAIVDELLNAASNHMNINDWKEYIKAYTNEIRNPKKSTTDDKVFLMTMHASKGLEFEVVFIPNLVEGNMPSNKAKTIEALEEERRMLYVAMTRAKQYLYMYSLQTFRGVKSTKSRFLKEINNGFERKRLDVIREQILESNEELKNSNIDGSMEDEQNKLTLTPTAIPEEIKKDMEVKHKDLGVGYVQEDKGNGKVEVYFPLFGKTTILDKHFQIKTGLLEISNNNKNATL